MISSIAKYVFAFVFLLAADVFIVSKFDLSFYLNPHIYIMFIILLPMFTERHLLMIVAFILGFIMDQFAGSGGIHAAACVIIAYMRSVFLGAFAPRESGYGRDDFLSMEKFGVVNFLFYCGFMIITFHFFLFLFELFSFRNILFTLLRTVASSILSLLIIIFIHLLFSRKASSK